MKPRNPITNLPYLSADLWQGSNTFSRNHYLTTLYVNHYVGPRHARDFTHHDFWEMTYVLNGCGKVSFEKQSLDLPTASALLIPPHMSHLESSDDAQWDTLWIAVKGKALDKLTRKQPYILQNGQMLLPWAHQILAWRQQQIGSIGPELDALSSFLLAATLRLIHQIQPNDQPDWLSRVLSHIHKQINQSITMEQLADIASCSRGHFHRQFHHATGETPLKYLSRHRMELALQYLRQTQWPIKTIAAKSGFHDPLYFSRCFRKAFHCSPVEARKTMQNKDNSH